MATAIFWLRTAVGSLISLQFLSCCSHYEQSQILSDHVTRRQAVIYYTAYGSKRLFSLKILNQTLFSSNFVVMVCVYRIIEIKCENFVTILKSKNFQEYLSI